MVASPPKKTAKMAPVVTWEPLPPDFVLPDDPVENIQQPPLAAALTDALGENQRIQPEMLIGSNFGLVATIDKKAVVKAPDWFYVPRVNPVPESVIRRSYTPHAEGAPVAVVMEFLSDGDYGELSIRPSPPYGKFYFYEQILQIPTYAIFNPHEPSLEVWQLEGNRYVAQTADEHGRFWIPELSLKLGLWYGERLGRTIHWLRWWDEADQLLLWSSEQADIERERAETERERAETERERAETERERAEALADKLRELGVDPNTLP